MKYNYTNILIDLFLDVIQLQSTYNIIKYI